MKHFEIKQVDQEKLVKVNDIKKVSNPVLFNATGGVNPDGLLSNEIFGVTKETRANIPAYIDLNEYFIQPYFYIHIMDKNIYNMSELSDKLESKTTDNK